MESSTRLVLEATNSNLYADSYPARAAEAVKIAEKCARWMNGNGHTVRLEIMEKNGTRRVKTATIDGKTWVRNGAFVNDPAAR